MRLAFLCLLLLAPAAFAQDAIHRCVATDGQAVFTDQPCQALNARPAVPEPQAGAISVDPTATSLAPTLCAADLDTLRQAIADAFAARDANRLGGITLWEGGRDSAVADLRQWAALVRQPLLAVEGNEHDGLTVRTSGSGGSNEAHFGLRRRSGCLWLAPG
ncbi:DUF4124 domain-containing protein [Pinirhizobacter sp.]|jgi:hypothetical protein|uniref:DUF4124 domain-containing protein n=1 Tax=Pinirhizobacter sp. TaxID=2950432 RepID=UPI002F3F3C90